MVGAILGAAWGFHSQWLVPIQRREAECLRTLGEVRQRISDAKVKIQEISEREQAIGGARGLLESFQKDVPEGPTAVWLPLRLRTHLRSAGIAEAGIRVNSAMPEPGVPGYGRAYWHVNVPMQDGMRTMNGLLLAVAEIERKESFARILDVSFVAGAEAPHLPVGGFNVTTLIPE